MHYITQHLRIYGKVQGVFYRESMRQKALSLDVRGWVRNRADGSVEAMLYGERKKVQALIEWAHTGPETAKVTSIEIKETEGSYDCFEKRETV